MKYLFKDPMVLTMNNEAKVIDGFDVLVENGSIAAMGAITPEQAEKAEIINAGGKLLMPGLINGHCHVPMTLLRNYADDMDLQTWLFQHIFPVEDKLCGQDIYWGSLLGIMEMLASGTTCFADMYYYLDDIARAVEESGIRAQLSRGMTCMENCPDYNENKSLNECINFYKNWNGAAGGRITAAFAPHAIYTCTPSFIEAVRDAAAKAGAPVHVHLDETRVEHEDSLRNYGKTPARHLYDLGLFDQKTIAAHCVWLTDEDILLLKEKRVSMVYNPGSNLKLASGVAPVPRAMEAGVNVILGTDGASSNNNLDLFDEINLAAIIHKGTELNPLLISAEEALKMVTVNAAKALGLDNTGIIKEGARADLILIDLDKPHFMPLHNPVSALVYSAHGSDVCLTMADGRILYEKGEFKTIDREKVRHNIKKITSRIF